MHTQFNKRNEKKKEDSAPVIFAFTVAPLIAMIIAMLAFGQPIGKWISDAAQAEFVRPENSDSEPVLTAQRPGLTLHVTKATSEPAGSPD